MKKGDNFYKVEVLVSKQDVDGLNDKLCSEAKSKSNIIFTALENNGIKVYDVSVHQATARIQERHIVLDVSENGESISRNGFNLYGIEE